jgi:gas vesicle protein
MSQYTCAAAALFVAMALGCSPRDRRDTSSSADSVAADVSRETRETAQEAREDVQEVRKDLGDFTYARRAEFRSDLDQRIQRLDQELAELERSTKKGLDKTRDSAIVSARTLRRSVDRSLQRLGTATASTWDDVKTAVSRSVDSLELAVRSLRSDARPMGGAGPS